MTKLKDAVEPMIARDLRDSNSAAMLYSYVERLERLDEERQALADDMKEIRGEAKGVGFDTKILGMVIRRRKMDASARLEQDSILELYEEAVRTQAKKQVADSEAEGGE